jgi:hypothetical protein
MADWRKSSYSNANGGDCVETASGDHTILVRDTANRTATTLNIPAGAWQRFTASLK